MKKRVDTDYKKGRAMQGLRWGTKMSPGYAWASTRLRKIATGGDLRQYDGPDERIDLRYSLAQERLMRRTSTHDPGA
jgi:hypothetical protein